MRIQSEILLIFASACHAISEANYEAVYNQTVDPFFFSTETAFFKGEHNVEINYWMRLAPSHSESNPSRALIVSPGRDVPLRNFAELFYDLTSEPYNFDDLSFYVLDHRGQGDSGKVDPSRDNKISDVKKFDDYVLDFEKFYTYVAAENKHSMYIVLGESMGGLVASLAMLKNPSAFQAAILSSPMYALQTGYPSWFSRTITTAATWLGFGSRPALGQKAFSAQNFPTSGVLTTSSSARYYIAQSFELQNPKEQIGGVSNRWIKEALGACSAFMSKNPALPIPTLILSAGMEMVVGVNEQEEVCKRTTSCTRKVYEHSYHEILFERDEIRDQAVEEIALFINNAL